MSPRTFFFRSLLVLGLFLLLPAGIHAAETPVLDSDGDGLSDAVEISLGTSIFFKDTDADGYEDRVEFLSNHDPSSTSTVQMVKSITIHTKSQTLDYFFNAKKVFTTRVSTGKASTPTPIGTFVISKKHPRAWSKMAALWMPWWMNFTGGRARPGAYAIHELPEWPGGKKEGAAHLGKPVSHGCVRLGVGVAKMLYEWTPIGTAVMIKAD